MVQAYQAPTRSQHRPSGGHEEAGHHDLAHADSPEDVRGVPGDLARLTEPSEPLRNRNNKAYMSRGDTRYKWSGFVVLSSVGAIRFARG